MVRVKPVLIALTLALAALAIPGASAALPAGCSFEGGDSDCRADAAGCMAHVHTYDVEDHPNVYEADCWGCGTHLGAGPAVSTDCIAYYPPPIASASLAEPVRYQCSAGMESSFCTLTAGPCHETTGRNQAGEVTYDWRDAGCTTPATGDCGAFTDSRGALRASCSTVYTGYCEVDAAASPPLAWCENYGPGDDASAAAQPGFPCVAGFAQTWCDADAGPCFVRVVPWTAWGDQYAFADCAAEGLACHVEAHREGPASEHSCAPAAAAASAPCVYLPPHAGIDCNVNGEQCTALIWLDLNPPNPTFDCSPPVCLHLPPEQAGIDCSVEETRCTVLIWLDLGPPNSTFDCLL